MSLVVVEEENLPLSDVLSGYVQSQSQMLRQTAARITKCSLEKKDESHAELIDIPTAEPANF